MSSDLHSNIEDVNRLLNVICPICNDSIGSHTIEEYMDCVEFGARLLPERHKLTQEIDYKPLSSGRYVRNIPRIRKGILVNVVF